MKILWLDTETTGLNREKCDIIQIAGIVTVDGEEKERFNFRCQPVNWENIEPASFEKTGMTLEKLKELSLPQEIYLKFKELLDKYIDTLTTPASLQLSLHSLSRLTSWYGFSYTTHQLTASTGTTVLRPGFTSCVLPSKLAGVPEYEPDSHRLRPSSSP